LANNLKNAANTSKYQDDTDRVTHCYVL